MLLPVDSYIAVKDLVRALAEERQRNPHMRLAFCFVGGGARGAYHGGMLEGIQQEIAKLPRGFPLAPDLYVGTSIGGIAGYLAWLEQMYPGGTFAPCSTRQAKIWQGFAAGNQAAQQLLSPACLVDFATNKRPIPLLSDINRRLTNLNNEWNAFTPEIAALGQAMSRLGNDLNNLKAQSIQDLVSRANTVAGAASGVADGITTILGDLGSLDPIKGVADAITEGGTILTAAGTVVSSITGLAADIKTLAQQTIPNTVSDGVDVAAKVGALISNSGALIGNLLLLSLEIQQVLALLTGLAAGLTVIISPASLAIAGVVPSDRLTGFLLDNTGLRNALSLALTASPRPIGGIFPMSPQGVLHDFVARSGQPIPEYFCTGADLSSKNLLVFSVARNGGLQALAANNYWVVDLAGTSHTASPNIMTPGAGVNEPLVEAVITSTSIPVAFPVRKWELIRPLPPPGFPNMMTHFVVDGGVLDNSPIDVALKAGATHIVSFELSPLINSVEHGTGVDPKSRNMVTALMDSFDALRDRVAIEQISSMTQANQANHTINPAKVVPVYRIAPLAPAPADAPKKPFPPFDTMNFNGLYDENFNLLMNLEDWFMQGYQDARLLPSHNAATVLDPFYKDYIARASGSATMKKSGAAATAAVPTVDFTRANKAWAAVNVAAPTTLP